ncbi:MAG: hypothetical protein AAF633_12570 [Chloroflexota bacterium]
MLSTLLENWTFSGTLFCYGPLFLTFLVFVFSALNTDAHARRTYLRILDKRTDAERGGIMGSPVAVAEAYTAATPAGGRVTIMPADELEKIYGIGPVIRGVLNRAGISTFAQLAQKTVDELDDILNTADVSNYNQPDTWPQQAEIAARGDWEAFEKMHEDLSKN